MIDEAELPRPLPVLESATRRADVIIPLFGVLLVDAADVRVVVPQRAVAVRTMQRERIDQVLALSTTLSRMDTDGVRFALHQPPAVAPAAPRPPASVTARHDGDLVYVTLEVPDAARTLEFYGSVLGWRSHRGRPAWAAPRATWRRRPPLARPSISAAFVFTTLPTKTKADRPARSVTCF